MTDKVANRKLRIEKMHEEKHATAIQAQWRGKMIRKQVVESSPTLDDDEDVIPTAPEDVKDLNVEQLREMQALKVESETLTKVHEPTLWPETLIENFEHPVADHTVPWPLLDGDSKVSWEWLLDYRKLIIRCVTWNLCGNQPPTRDEIRKLVLPLNK